jgi:hypothetical protein
MATKHTTYNTLTPARKFQILTAMSDHIEPDGDKYIRYKNGTTDEKIAEQWGLPVKSVQRLRRSTFGTFSNKWNRLGKNRKQAKGRSPVSGKQIKALTEEVTQLRNEVVALRGQVSSIQDHLNIPARPTPRPSTELHAHPGGTDF